MVAEKVKRLTSCIRQIGFLSLQWRVTLFHVQPFYSIGRMSTLGFDSMDRAQRTKETVADFLPVRSRARFVRLQLICYNNENA